MTEQTKTNNKTWIPIVLIGVVLVAGAVVITLRNNQAATEYVDDSGNIVVSQNNPFSQWFGKSAPDFTVTDIEGKQHSLSDYIGKNVLVVFWATWCPPCRVEIPHLIELRKQESEDDLAIIAISNEGPEKVKNFAQEKQINYTVATVGNSVIPSPFIDVQYIPTSFFIDSKGRIKYAVVQSLTLEQIKNIFLSINAGNVLSNDK